MTCCEILEMLRKKEALQWPNLEAAVTLAETPEGKLRAREYWETRAQCINDIITEIEGRLRDAT